MTDETQDTPAAAPDYTLTRYVAADAKGAILVCGNVPAFMVAAQTPPAGGSIVLGNGDPATDWVTGGAITARPANPTTLAGTVLSNVPNPSTVTINDVDYAVTDGELDMTFPVAGTYAITVTSAFPYLDGTFTITQ